MVPQNFQPTTWASRRHLVASEKPSDKDAPAGRKGRAVWNEEGRVRNMDRLLAGSAAGRNN